MKVNIHAIGEEGLDLSDEISGQELGLDPNEFEVEGACHLSIRVRKLGHGFHVRGSARTTIVQTCGRCLARAPQTVAPEFSMVYEPAGGTSPTIESDVTSRDLGVTFFEGTELDLSPEIRQAVLLALPLKPLCRETCKGLCPTCGANLNDGPCACAPHADAPAATTLEGLAKKWADRRGK